MRVDGGGLKLGRSNFSRQFRPRPHRSPPIAPTYARDSSELRPLPFERRIADQDSLRIELANPLRRHLKQLAQNSLVVLAQSRRTHFGPIRPCRKLHRHTQNRDRAQNRILAPENRLAL